MENTFKTSDFEKNSIPSEFYEILFWNNINDGFYESGPYIVFRYVYSDLKLEASFYKDSQALKYIMLEGGQSNNNGELKIVDDIDIFNQKSLAPVVEKKLKAGKISFYYDDEDNFLDSVYFFPKEMNNK